MQFYNTLTRRKQEFVPMEDGKVRMYCCGPTVYNYAHIGNLRAYIFNDTLHRALTFNGYGVTHVMNITDVGHLESDADDGDDKMEKGAAREGLSVWDIARKYEEAFFADTAKLNILRPEVVCRATEHIVEMIALVERLVEKGYAYVTENAVYYDTSRFPTYADFAHLNLVGQEEEFRRVQTQSEKHNPTDFALWFHNKPRHLMQWDSPWGRGYPGWHIECSAMSMKYLGETFDIHCGGIDHIPVHHTNEIAQSEGATGKPFVHYWMHNEFLIVTQPKTDENGTSGAEKMSKSGENFLTLARVTDRGFNPLAYRYLCLQAHYRSELRFSWEALEGAQNGLRKVYSTHPDSDPLRDDTAYQTAYTEVLAALNDDLNTPMMVGLLNKYSSYRLWTAFDAVLGLDIAERTRREEAPLTDEVQRLIAERNAARQAKEWARSDTLRNALIEMGYEVGDGPEGTTVKRRLV